MRRIAISLLFSICIGQHAYACEFSVATNGQMPTNRYVIAGDCGSEEAQSLMADITQQQANSAPATHADMERLTAAINALRADLRSHPGVVVDGGGGGRNCRVIGGGFPPGFVCPP